MPLLQRIYITFILLKMELKKILVYDKEASLARFLKKEFGKSLEFEFYKNFYNDYSLDDLQLEYLFVVFVIYSEMDLFDFIKIYDKKVPIIVFSFRKELLVKFEGLRGVHLLDGSVLKQEIIDYFQSFLATHAEYV